ncbi:hypothetical protein OMK64_01890 [Cellulomonas fimi]|uniref:hypothetical protein n=1 Tax=Cellulomonas fimi TaxID=1708 RepID=UPI00234CFA31|nr:hypothetical protein [Cellulomonas fimi]MDC7120283.1 hypothetical protein [Cellulomonas fimi]
MSNTFKATDVAAVAVSLATKGFVLSNEVYRDIEAEYSRGTGHTAQVVIPAAAKATLRAADAYGTAIPASDLQEQSVPVTLQEAHARAVIGEAERSLGITDFARSVLLPLTGAVAEACEAQVASLVNGVALSSAITYTSATLPSAITAARSVLRGNGVATSDEIVAFLGTAAYAKALDSGLLEDSDAIRKVRVVETDRMVNPDDIVVAAPKRAFALAVKAPQVPDGAPYGASVKDDKGGFALRYLETFDSTIAATTALVSAFVGAAALPLPVYDAATGTANLVEGGAAIRFTLA